MGFNGIEALAVAGRERECGGEMAAGVEGIGGNGRPEEEISRSQHVIDGVFQAVGAGNEQGHGSGLETDAGDGRPLVGRVGMALSTSWTALPFTWRGPAAV